VVGRTPAAVRQLASRARRHVTAAHPRRPVSEAEHRRLVEAFARATSDGDLEALTAVLDPDVVFTADGGGRATAARRPLLGARRVAKAWIAITRRASAVTRSELVTINDRAGLLIEDPEGGDRTALAFTVDGGRITRIDVMRNPAKLRRMFARP
jgi:RNA polymerase sigma-70 factor (ECF subfamily)